MGTGSETGSGTGLGAGSGVPSGIGSGTGRQPTTIEVALGARSYRVVVGDGLATQADRAAGSLLAEALDRPGVGLPDRALLVTQQAVVDAGHVDPVEAALARAGIEVARALVPDGEAAKSVEVLAGLWRTAALAPLSRRDVVVAVGGGVVGDLGGFLAATYARGIDVVQIPTTLLGQVDAAIGGKTGINLPGGKNLVGAFHQPRVVLCDVSTLTTLPPRILREGLGEVVKCGLIRDPEILRLLEEEPGSVGQGGSGGILRELVERSVAVKATVVSGDERESGERAVLNLGHTVGHAVESVTGYQQILHGEAVSMGMVAALRIGVALGVTTPGLVDRVESLLTSLGLPVRVPALDRAGVWAAMARDKKAAAGQVRFVLLRDVGQVVLEVPPREVVDAVLDEVTDATEVSR